MKKVILLASTLVLLSTFATQSHAVNKFGFSWWKLDCDSTSDWLESMEDQLWEAGDDMRTRGEDAGWSDAKIERRVAKIEAIYQAGIDKLNYKYYTEFNCNG